MSASRRLTAVRVEAAATDRFSVKSSIAVLPGTASRLAVERIDPNQGNPRFAVYGTSSCISCSQTQSTCSLPIVEGDKPVDPPTRLASASLEGWIPGFAVDVAQSLSLSWLPCTPGNCEFLPLPGGGGPGGSHRKVWFGVRVVEATLSGGLLTGFTQVCEENILVSTVPSETTAPIWEDVGLDFDAGRSKIYVVSPETNELVVVDADDFYETTRIAVGDHPFDVRVVSTAAGERAYVVNHGDAGVANSGTLSVVDTSIELQTGFRDVGLDTGDANDLGLARIDASLDSSNQVRFLYLVATDRERLLTYDARGVSNANDPVFAIRIPVGKSPGDLALQKP